ncbi:hypothetical protein BDN72DRAFT_850398 [Pluteus cervinus]|uniref:Uncharacterized protein n=1 Tax=Pluteus cervinus TaxID=181527 RepID=A0ACD3A4T5_9AGAR|nr:hypothetical protein BDN72DRAFT_850398 [Pluteus cervinus]
MLAFFNLGATASAWAFLVEDGITRTLKSRALPMSRDDRYQRRCSDIQRFSIEHAGANSSQTASCSTQTHSG